MDDEGEDSSAKDDPGGEDNEPSGVVEAGVLRGKLPCFELFRFGGVEVLFSGDGA